MIENIVKLNAEQLIPEVQKLQAGNWRFIAITAVNCRDGLELLYHFNLHNEVKHLQVGPGLETEVMPSISAIYKAAYLSENEIQGFFALRFSDLKPDYGTTMLMPADPAPTKVSVCNAPLKEERP